MKEKGEEGGEGLRGSFGGRKEEGGGRTTREEDDAAKMAVGTLYHLSANNDSSLRGKLVQNELIFSVLADEVIFNYFCGVFTKKIQIYS